MALTNYKSMVLLDEYLNYLEVIKGRSHNTVIEYRTDILMFLDFICEKRGIKNRDKYDVSMVNADFLNGITLSEMYDFVGFCQTKKMSSPGTRSRKIVSIRQFWKYLKNKRHVLEENVAEELETPKQPKRLPKHLTLEESVRLLMMAEESKRDYCILTIFLNCALRLSELISLDVDMVQKDTISIVGKGDKERTIFLTPATKKAINDWLAEREILGITERALFTSKFGTRLTGRAVEDIVKKYLKKAGIEKLGWSCHLLRHTACTMMYQYGNADLLSLQTIMGHTSVATTQIYASASKQQLENAVNANPLSSMFGIR